MGLGWVGLGLGLGLGLGFGLEVQQPPSMLTSPVSRKSLTDFAKLSGVSS